LAPAWPSRTALKSVLAQAVAWCLPGGWLVWLAVTALVYGLGSVTLDQVVTGAAVMSAASTAITGNLLLLLSRRTLKAWHASALMCLALPAVGALLIALRQGGASILIGVVLLAVPTLVGAAIFVSRPLQFPVNIAR
jgi:hypothetical protein